MRYRHQGRTRKLTIPGFPKLADARQQATAALAELVNGIDPAQRRAGEAEKARREADATAGDTVRNLVEQFLKVARKETRDNTFNATKRVLENLVVPKWGPRQIREITRRDVRQLINALAEQKPVAANRALSTISRFFNWAIEQDVIEASPCRGIRKPAKEEPRSRVLGDDEINKLWAACEAVGGHVGAFVKVLLLTGQRRSEVAGLRRSEIVGDVWELPPERAKNKRQHSVPLSTQAIGIIEALPEGEFVFGGKQVVGGYSRAKRAIDVHAQLPRWQFHDLRRSAVSGMAALGTDIHVIERVINHLSGTFRGVLGVYQRHEFAAEKRVALQRWADHIDQIITGQPAKVLPFGKRP